MSHFAASNNRGGSNRCSLTKYIQKRSNSPELIEWIDKQMPVGCYIQHMDWVVHSTARQQKWIYDDQYRQWSMTISFVWSLIYCRYFGLCEQWKLWNTGKQVGSRGMCSFHLATITVISLIVLFALLSLDVFVWCPRRRTATLWNPTRSIFEHELGSPCDRNGKSNWSNSQSKSKGLFNYLLVNNFVNIPMFTLRRSNQSFNK